MLFTNPDVTRTLVAERRVRLLAEAEEHRRARRPAARWRPARFRLPTADRQRVTPPAAPAAPAPVGQPGRAA
ncbi:MAG TPA: hypothetical protein VF880_20410 [Actinomycetes bacterium]